jgi:hypothetical protein
LQQLNETIADYLKNATFSPKNIPQAIPRNIPIRMLVDKLNFIFFLFISVTFFFYVKEKYRLWNIDKIVKSRFKDWISAFAGMTCMVSMPYNLPFL